MAKSNEERIGLLLDFIDELILSASDEEIADGMQDSDVDAKAIIDRLLCMNRPGRVDRTRPGINNR